MVIDRLSKMLDVKVNKIKLQGNIGDTRYKQEKIILVKPNTYMNLSGNCVTEVLNFYKASPQDLIVIYDDIDIAVGKIRIKASGSPGTHNGMKDITAKLGTRDFIRIRVGSGKPKDGEDLVDYVLGTFKSEEVDEIRLATENATKAVIEILDNGVVSAMNKFN